MGHDLLGETVNRSKSDIGTYITLIMIVYNIAQELQVVESIKAS